MLYRILIDATASAAQTTRRQQVPQAAAEGCTEGASSASQRTFWRVSKVSYTAFQMVFIRTSRQEKGNAEPRPFAMDCSLFIFLDRSRRAMAQIAGSGAIQGTVTDSSGAVVPQAAITAINQATGVETPRQTTAAGLYVLSPLPAGEYNVRVTATGFQTLIQENVVVDATSVVGLNLELKVGSTSEQVTVEAAGPALHTEDVTLGGHMENRVYDSLPLAMGSGVPCDPTLFIALVPGVASVVTQASGPSYTSFNGAQQENNELYLEGVAMTFPNREHGR